MKLSSEELRRLNSMCYFIEQARKYNIKPKIIFDIGAYNAAHLQELGAEFGVPKENLYAFEAHPGMIKHCRKRTDNVFNCAISNVNTTMDFNAIDLSQNCHHGCSSLYGIKRPHKTIPMTVRRIDTLMTQHQIPHNPDMVKIDVEGASYEVLDGFGVVLKCVKILHVETEITEHFPGQKLQKDVVDFMESVGFVEVHRLHIPKNQDDIIFLRKDLQR